jgi:hypothetical protein
VTVELVLAGPFTVIPLSMGACSAAPRAFALREGPLRGVEFAAHDRHTVTGAPRAVGCSEADRYGSAASYGRLRVSSSARTRSRPIPGRATIHCDLRREHWPRFRNAQEVCGPRSPRFRARRRAALRGGASRLGLWALRICGTVRRGLDSLAADGETMDPAGRVALMIAS